MMQHTEFGDDGGLHGGLGSLLDSLNWDHVRSEVTEEGRARVALVGLPGAGKSTLLNAMRGWEVSPVQHQPGAGNRMEDLGLFLLADLSEHGPAASGATSGLSDGAEDPWIWELLTQADVIVFVFDGALHLSGDGAGSADVERDSLAARRQHWQLVEYQWYSRIKALGRPVAAVLSKRDLLQQEQREQEVCSTLAQRLVAAVTPLCALNEEEATLAVSGRLLEANPKLLVALGRELPAIRRQAARKLINQTVLFAGLAGLQPVPLLDLPLQLGLQMRMLLRLDALYGRSQQGDASRELIASLAGGMAVRLLAQTLVKFVPVLGWAISGALSGLSAWLLGWGAVALLEGRHLRLRQAAADLAARRPAVVVRLPALPAGPLGRRAARNGAAGEATVEADGAVVSASSRTTPPQDAGVGALRPRRWAMRLKRPQEDSETP